jgi:hypothetical protein
MLAKEPYNHFISNPVLHLPKEGRNGIERRKEGKGGRKGREK